MCVTSRELSGLSEWHGGGKGVHEKQWRYGMDFKADTTPKRNKHNEQANETVYK